MSLHQTVDELIGRWEGLDATERFNKREQMITDLLAAVAAGQGAGADTPVPPAPRQPKQAA